MNLALLEIASPQSKKINTWPISFRKYIKKQIFFANIFFPDDKSRFVPQLVTLSNFKLDFEPPYRQLDLLHISCAKLFLSSCTSSFF
jgi:hypothetical protein